MSASHRKVNALNTSAAKASGDLIGETDRRGSVSKRSGGKSPRSTKTASDSPLGLPSASPRASSKAGQTTPRKGVGKAGASSKDGKTSATAGAKADKGGAGGSGGKGDKPRDLRLLSASPMTAQGASGDSEPKQAAKTEGKKEIVGPNAKKVEFLSDELLNRKPLDDKARETLIKKCGPPKQEVNFERNENHRPAGRPDELMPSRHERIPPSHIVLMFNCVEASFTLSYGDISTLPESDTSELRSLTSGKVLGRVKVTPEKGAMKETEHPAPAAIAVACTMGLRRQLTSSRAPHLFTFDALPDLPSVCVYTYCYWLCNRRNPNRRSSRIQQRMEGRH
jgi:hypothetical protein